MSTTTDQGTATAKRRNEHRKSVRAQRTSANARIRADREEMVKAVLDAKDEFDQTVMRNAHLTDHQRLEAWGAFKQEWGSVLKAIYP